MAQCENRGAKMKKYVIIFFFSFILLQLSAQSWEYDIRCAGVGVQGTYLVEVSGYGKTVEKAISEIKKAAVHGVLFRGISGECNQKPIINDPGIESSKADFFNKFFSDNGDYAKYVAAVNNTNYTPSKVGKRYKVTMLFSVKKDMLRKDMETAGIIKSLGAGF